MSMPLFFLSSVAMLISALGVVFSREALQSVLWMFALLLGLGGVMSGIGANLIGLTIVLVYAGAILVLFTFVVMFVGQKLPRQHISRPRLLLALFVTLIAEIFFACLGAPMPTIAHAAVSTGFSDPIKYGTALFSHYSLPVILVGWLLLWVAVGAFDILGAVRKESR